MAKNLNPARTNRTRIKVCQHFVTYLWHIYNWTEPKSKKCARTQTELYPRKNHTEPEYKCHVLNWFFH